MSYSYYEVYTNAQRAFSGLGFSYGSDEDAAFVTTWLEVCGLNGIKLLSSKINELDNNFNAIIDPKSITSEFDCKNKSSLMIGPGLIDFLVSKINDSLDLKIVIKNCSDPIFLIPLLYKYSKKNISSELISNKKVFAQVTNKNISIIKDLVCLSFLEDFELILTKNIINEKILDTNIKPSYINEAIAKGINPDLKSWKKISEIAFRTFVPESEESRAKGAGGGDAND